MVFCHCADKGARKAHPKAERFGGSKKVKGLKHIEKETIGVQGKTTAALSSEDLSLLARLDELEKRETANAELYQWDDFDNDDKNSVRCSNKDDDVRWEMRSIAQDKESDGFIKKVKWDNFDAAKDTGRDSGNSDDDGEDGNGDVKTTIAVKFSSSPKSVLQKVRKYFKRLFVWLLQRKNLFLSLHCSQTFPYFVPSNILQGRQGIHAALHP